MNPRNVLALVVLALPVIFLGGCLLESEPSGSESIVVESDQVVYGPEERVKIKIENRTGKAAFFPRCDTLVYDLERRQNDGWKRLGGANICPANLSMVPIELKAGNKREMKFGKSELGKYRFVVGYGFEAESAGKMEAVSNAFKIDEQ